jgi:hypothetical protein
MLNTGPGTIACEERIFGDPSRRDDGVLQQRKHYMASAEHERAGAVERGCDGCERSADLLRGDGTRKKQREGRHERHARPFSHRQRQ